MGRNDVRAKKDGTQLYVECKKTSKSQITLHKEWFDKLQEPFIATNRELMIEPLIFAFQPDKGMQLEPYVCLSLDGFLYILSLLKELDV